MGLLTKEDSEIFRGCFKEMAKLRGIHELYKYPIDKSRTIHSELVVAKYSDTIETDVIFDTSPKLATLRRLGWVSETQDDKPYIIQVAYDLPELQYGCIITLPAPAGMSGKDFRVTDIQFIDEGLMLHTGCVNFLGAIS